MQVYIGGHGCIGGKSGGIDIVTQFANLGFMFTPFDYRKNYDGKVAVDNGAFSAWVKKTEFNEGAFLKLLGWIKHADFIIIPDIVAGGLESLYFSMRWLNRLPAGFNYYLAVQDGLEPMDIPYSVIQKIKGIFVGGTLKWKLKNAQKWVDYAHTQGLKCHIGRIGTLKRLMWAETIGADSVDSSNFAQHEKNWLELIQWLKGEQTRLNIAVIGND